jgi:hypothetical protein
MRASVAGLGPLVGLLLHGCSTGAPPAGRAADPGGVAEGGGRDAVGLNPGVDAGAGGAGDVGTAPDALPPPLPAMCTGPYRSISMNVQPDLRMKEAGAVGRSLAEILCAGTSLPCKPIAAAGAPSARWEASTSWVGGKLLVYGGWVMGSDGRTPQLTNTGALYDPRIDAWIALPAAGAPTPRLYPLVLSIGERVLVYGGLCQERSGAIFDLARNEWRAMSVDGAPAVPLSASWGDRARVAGGRVLMWPRFSGGPLDTGYVYDVDRDSWSLVPAPPIPPRTSYASGSSGTQIFTFGGTSNLGGAQSLLDDGALLDLTTLTWRKAAATGAPAPRSGGSVFWNGTRFVVTGGFRPPQGSTVGAFDGGLYDPVQDSWSALEATSVDPETMPPGTITSDGFSATSIPIDGGSGGPGIILGPRVFGVDSLCGERLLRSPREAAAGAPNLRRVRLQVCDRLFRALEALLPPDKLENDEALVPITFKQPGPAPLPQERETSWRIDLTSLNGVWTGDRLVVWGGRYIRNTKECREDGGPGPGTISIICVQEHAFSNQGLVVGPL